MKKILFLPAVLFLSAALQAQVAVTITGGDASGSGGSVSFTVGQVCYQSVGGYPVQITQGVQQPYDISIETGMPDITGIDLTCSAYPNPVGDYLTLSIENLENDHLYYQLYTIDGKILDTAIIKKSKTTIDLRFLNQSTYFLKVSDRVHPQAETVKVFKIVKK